MQPPSSSRTKEIFALLIVALSISGCVGGPKPSGSADGSNASTPVSQVTTSAEGASIPPANQVTTSQEDVPTAPSGAYTQRPLQLKVPLESAKGYMGYFYFAGSTATVALGDPGKLIVTPPAVQVAEFGNKTVGGRTAYLSRNPGLVVSVGWRLPEELAQYSDLTAADCSGGGCDLTSKFLLAEVVLNNNDSSMTTPRLDATTQLSISKATMVSPRAAVFSDANGGYYRNGGATRPAQFPESANGALEEMLNRGPTVAFVTPWYYFNEPFSFGSLAEDDPLISPVCEQDSGAEPYRVLGVFDQTGEPLAWPAVHTIEGQPCHSKAAKASG